MIKKSCIVISILVITSCSQYNIFSQQYTFDTVVTGLNLPVAFTFLPNNNVILTQRAGLSRIFTLNNTFISNFWNFTDSTVTGSEAGLIGVCLDPNYQSNNFIYFYYIHTGGRYRVVRLTNNNNAGTNPYIVFNDTLAILTSHVAGNIRFGKDSKLYISIGDNGNAANSQSLNTFKGKIIRINADGSIPTDNPFYDDGNPETGNDDRIWAMGFRNSFDFCFSPFNDSLYSTENCNGFLDEINFIRKGKNYGWPSCDGFCFPYNPAYKNPMTEIPGSGISNYAPTGIIAYNGSQYPELAGKLLIVGAGGGFSFNGILKCELGNPPFLDTIISKTIIHETDANFTSMQQGNDGYVYILRHSASGYIVRLKHDLTSVPGIGQAVGYSLSQNYPNPFNPTTSIKYSLSKEGFTSIKIYDAVGNEVSSLVNANKKAGEYEVTWKADGFATGIYFYRMEVNGQRIEKKMVLIK